MNSSSASLGCLCRSARKRTSVIFLFLQVHVQDIQTYLKKLSSGANTWASPATAPFCCSQRNYYILSSPMCLPLLTSTSICINKSTYWFGLLDSRFSYESTLTQVCSHIYILCIPWYHHLCHTWLLMLYLHSGCFSDLLHLTYNWHFQTVICYIYLN